MCDRGSVALTGTHIYDHINNQIFILVKKNIAPDMIILFCWINNQIIVECQEK
jgi:hypothetical protein